MAEQKRFTDYDQFTDVADDDILLGVDVSDTTDSAEGSTKRLTYRTLTSPFLADSTNLFDPGTSEVGAISSSDGSLNPGFTNYRASDFIPVEPGKRYWFYGFLTRANYGANKDFIGRPDMDPAGSQYLVPAHVRYVRLSYRTDVPEYEGTQQVNQSETLLPYEPFGRKLSGVHIGSDVMGHIKSDPAIARATGLADRPMIDLPVGGVFSGPAQFEDWADYLNNAPAADIYQKYDDLMTLHPEYISKEVLGNDGLGNPIAVYRFAPPRPSSARSIARPKAFITCGVHGTERVPPLVMYLTMKEIIEQWEADAQLEALRWNVEFLVIPVANPSGWNAFERKNHNGVDINRNFPEDWVQGDPGDSTYGGSAPLSEPEAQYISQVFDENPDIGICYDFHNFSGGPGDERFIWIPTGAGALVENLGACLLQRMTRLWRSRYAWIPPNDDWFAGNTSATHGGMVQDHAMGRGVLLAGTFEVCNKWLVDEGSVIYDPIHRQTCVEAWINWLLLNLRELTR